MLRIDEPLPPGALEGEVVLHVRLHLRKRIKQRVQTAPNDLAMLFGFPPEDGRLSAWEKAAGTENWRLAGAQVAAQQRPSPNGVVLLGHDAEHVQRCKEWLRRRKDEDDSFESTIATDLATLLELSRARDLTQATGLDDDNKQYPLPILIQGPTGSGKELLAHGIHRLASRLSRKQDAPFEVVQVAGMADTLISDELFGHEKGAFTGAEGARDGRIHAADGGTLLIDEVGDLPSAAQLALLRFLQTRRVSRLGTNKSTKLNVRIIAATWHDLEKDVREGRFREDLLYRLRAGSGLVLRSLSEREGVFDEVVPELLRRRRHPADPLITRSALDALALQPWSGNLRDLVRALEYAISLSGAESIRIEHLPPHIQRSYLALPLHDRAEGFLSDEYDGEKLNDTLLRWRVAEVNQSLDGCERPAANAELSQVGDFLTLLDDAAPEHQRSVQEIRDILALDQERRHVLRKAEVWERIASSRMPKPVVSAARKASEAAKAGFEELGTRLQTAQSEATYDQNTWLRLLREVQTLPILRDAHGGDIAAFFLMALNGVKLVAPGALDWIREQVKAGGFTELRTRFMERLQRDKTVVDVNGQYETETVVEGLARRPLHALTDEDWQSIAHTYPTLSAAAKAIGCDPKTIKDRLKTHGIENPWRRARVPHSGKI